jgi:hypothetical protein
MSNIELDNYDDYRNLIKEKILSCQNLWELIYFQSSNPLEQEYPENPYEIFEESNDGTHGFVLFKEKEVDILNSNSVIVLINFSSHRNSTYDSIQDVKIEIKIIFKGEIEVLADETSRSHRIAELLDENLNGVKIDNNSKIRRESFDILSINEQNYGSLLIFTTKTTDYTDEIQIYQHEQKEDTNGIIRESYSLMTTDNPIIVDIHEPQTDTKLTQQFGYNMESIRTMICDIRPEITESSIIKYNDNYYRIREIIEYEDYWSCTLVITYDAIINV